MSTMQSTALALLEETDQDARYALGRQLAMQVLRLLCPADEPEPVPTEEPTDDVYDDEVPF
jgi:hypothetical protein